MVHCAVGPYQPSMLWLSSVRAKPLEPDSSRSDYQIGLCLLNMTTLSHNHKAAPDSMVQGCPQAVQVCCLVHACWIDAGQANINFAVTIPIPTMSPHCEWKLLHILLSDALG